MATDPWHWTFAQVADFFRNDAANYISDMPNARLPDMHTFAHNLEENDVSGATLLNGSVDTSFLKEDCGIRSLGMRSAILHCVSKLKSESTFLGGKNLSAPSVPQTPASMHGDLQPAAELPAQIPVFDPIGEEANSGGRVRGGEVEIRDERGIKRRKLDLQPLPPMEKATGGNAPAAAGFMSDAGLPVDHIFYGTTKIGEEIELEPDKDTFDEGKDQSFEYFGFSQSEKPPGEVGYVYKQLQHYFQNGTTHDEEVDTTKLKSLKRRGRNAVALYPYRETLFRYMSTKKAVSATVIPLDSQDPEELVALRDNAAYLESGIDYSVLPDHLKPPADESGEWDFLARKWGQVPDQSEDAQSDDESITSSLQREIERDEAEEERDRQKFLGENEVTEVIDESIADLVNAWKADKEPGLEEKSAWTMWRKTKRSKAIRDQLVAGAKSRISELNNRLAKQKKRLMEDSWDSKAKLKDMCSVMDATVEDIQMQKWKIDVWQRKQEPYHVVRHGQKQTSSGKPSASAPNPGFVVHPDDRMSVEPAEQAPAQDDSFEGEQFHTPDGSPVPNHDDGNEGDESDQMSVDDSPMADFVEESPSHSLGGLERSNRNDEEYNTHEATEDEGDEVQPESLNDSESFVTDADHDSTELASPPPFARSPSRKEQKPDVTPIKMNKSTSARDDVIVISSDSTPSSGKKLKRAASQRQANYTGEATDATYNEVNLWDMDVLVERQDRKRLLIKLLAAAGRQWMTLALRYLIKFRQIIFQQKVQNALLTLRPDLTRAGDTEQDQVMFSCARLFLAFHFCAPHLVDGKTNLKWQTALHKTGDVLMFSNLLENLLKKKDEKLFVAPKLKSKAQSKQVSHNVIDLDTDSEGSQFNPDTRSNKRKKKLAGTRAVQQSQMHQEKALERQDRFKAAQSQPAFSSQPLSQESPMGVMMGSSHSEIQINLLKDDDQKAICVDKRIAKEMKDHQIKGVQFMWRELTAGADAQGCILAHTMGLGKTMQAITLLVALNEAAQSTNPAVFKQLPEHLRLHGSTRQLRALVLCPASLLANWRNEIRRWAPKKLANVWLIESSPKAKLSHDESLRAWYDNGGVILIGYETFRNQVGGKNKNNAQDGMGAQTKNKGISEYLTVDPEVVIADEAHRMKDQKSQISNAARDFKTESRVALTGTPMSNDVQEIYSLVSWAAPDYLGGAKWFNAQYTKPIQDGNGKESTTYQRRKGLKKLNLLHRKIEPKVDRANISVLKGSLTDKVEFVITLPLFGSQLEAYRKYVAALLGNDDNQKASQVLLFSWLQVLTLLTNHPLCFKRKLLEAPKPSKSRQKARDPTPASDTGSVTPQQNADPADEENIEEAIQRLGFSREAILDIVKSISDDASAELSAKMTLLLDIIQRSKEQGDKVLVFSFYIPVLDYVGDLLHAAGFSYGRIDGSVPPPKREPILKDFQDGRTDVMLISTKAGGVGLNIQQANRVVILDSHFNPVYEAQAIGRAYRLGQHKPVYVYRMMIGGTFETNIHDKQNFKQVLINRVVDKKNTKRAGDINTREYLYEPKDVPVADDLREYIDKDQAVLGKILKNQMKQTDKEPLVRTLETMETLMVEEQESLTAEELKEVEEEWEVEKYQARTFKKGVGPAVAQTPMGPPRSTQPAPRTKNPTAQSRNYVGGPHGLVRLPVGNAPSYPSTAPGPRTGGLNPFAANGMQAPQQQHRQQQEPPPPPQMLQMPHGLPDFPPTGPGH